jgi:tetratricopeptide (TPR) repeat protein
VVDAQPEPTPGANFEAAEIPAESAVHEVDLSEEWAALAGQVSDNAVPVTGETAEPSNASLSDAATAPPSAETLAEYELALDSAPANGTVDRSPGDADSFLRSLSAELDAFLTVPPGELSGASQPAGAVPPPAAGDSSDPSAPETKGRETGGPLGEMFDAFRAEMGESSEQEDLETHYNLGVAYREMGLIEEAISEFQRVAQAHHRGQPFPYTMQCYTLLGLAFMEKRQPSIAATWYERALEIPGLDPETVLALRYDLGVAQEMAGDMAAAHRSFSQVYGMNIDYRDVAERLAALGRMR